MYSRNHDITIQEIRAIKRFKDWDDSRILLLQATIKTFSILAYQIYNQQKDSGKVFVLSIDNQLDV